MKVISNFLIQMDWDLERKKANWVIESANPYMRFILYDSQFDWSMSFDEFTRWMVLLRSRLITRGQSIYWPRVPIYHCTTFEVDKVHFCKVTNPINWFYWTGILLYYLCFHVNLLAGLLSGLFIVLLWCIFFIFTTYGSSYLSFLFDWRKQLIFLSSCFVKRKQEIKLFLLDDT